MRKIFVTGAKGTVGTVLVKNLKGYKITKADLPEIDIMYYKIIFDKVKEHAIVHLSGGSMN